MTARHSTDPAGVPVLMPQHPDLIAALVHGRDLDTAVPAALHLVRQNPLASAGQFAGDVLRALMEVPGSFWGRYPQMFDSYQAALRAGAVQRRALPPDARLDFWSRELTSGDGPSSPSHNITEPGSRPFTSG
jgi:hypothetical protein